MLEHDFHVQNMTQLEALREISLVFSSLQYDFWLRGGWAIDFLLGRVTRLHDDVDLVTWVHYRDKIEQSLRETGYEQIPVREPFNGRQSDFRKDTVDLTICYITRSEDGSIILNDLPEWVWRSDSLLEHRFVLNGISAHVLSPQQLLEEKEVYQQIGRIPRPKDAESKKLLHRIIEQSV
ncbi:hypothetical protein NZD89_02870 [Alicyclobacillus fastidiosus]|uniref:Aminoglycoside-2''-adenylyltransferase n=1 Tax=Alicyclobacillus fastidiosus TaxID=392011 RepID=A0ABY6ZHW1_9BACL|nr:hypothetical protein [Alicyclobacillus fastidiosus]WAH42459.1 hypothetical protein NZD89_02870 [Alicyclobacillus fastidiosus]GMA64292.1 hypothetical protein GCM10025859_47320 [Alicyclobacillus fastidiosus]